MNKSKLLDEIIEHIYLAGLDNGLTSSLISIICDSAKKYNVKPSESYLQIKFARQLMDKCVERSEIRKQIMERFSVSRSQAYTSIRIAFNMAPYSMIPVEISDAYVASCLKMPTDQIPKELIELKRAQLQITRKLKELKK